MRRSVLALGLLLTAGCGAAPVSGGTLPEPAPAQAEASQRPAAPGRLPEATTFTTVRRLPADPAPRQVPSGTVVHPLEAKVLHDEPAGRPVATLPKTQLDGPTWVPVVETVPGWHRVLLPSKPNRSTGWITADKLETAHSPYLIRVRTERRQLTLLKSGRPIGKWRVAVGAPGTPTPTGRTFLLASMLTKSGPPHRDPSRVVLPVGTHSATLDTFGGGPGTVAFHGWPDAKTFGQAASHGCVRVPATALTALSRVPLGSPVLITS